MNFLFYNVLIIYVFIKAGFIQSENIIIEKINKNNSIIQNKITTNRIGEFITKGIYFDYTININFCNIIINLIKDELYFFFNRIIIIENNDYNVSIYLNETKIFSKISIFKFDYIKSKSYFLKRNFIFENVNKYKSNIKGYINLNIIEQIKKRKNITINQIQNKGLYKKINIEFDIKEKIKFNKKMHLNKLFKKKGNQIGKKKIKKKIYTFQIKIFVTKK